MASIVLQHPQIIGFFGENTHIDPTQFVLNAINVYNYITSSLTPDTNAIASKIDSLKILFETSTVVTQKEINYLKEHLMTLSGTQHDSVANLLSQIDHVKNSLESQKNIDSLQAQNLQHELNNIKTAVANLNKEVIQNLGNKFADIKQQYLNELLEIGNKTETVEKLKSLIQNNNQLLIQNTSSLLHETLPRLHLDSLQRSLDSFKLLLIEHTNQLPSQQNLTVLSENLSNKFSEITQNILRIEELNSKANDKVSEVLDLFKKSSTKGSISENIMYKVLNKACPSAEIIETSQVPKSCDFRIKRENEFDILIENKNFTNNVPLSDIQKFQRDIEFQNCPGIMISQFSGICNKPNFYIELVNNVPIMYIHNLNYNVETLQLAINTIDILYLKLQQTACQEDTALSIDEKTLNKVKMEIQNFMNKKNELSKYLRDTHRNTLDQLSSLSLPTIINIISPSNTPSFTCPHCDFSSVHQNGINSHLKYCKFKPKADKS